MLGFVIATHGEMSDGIISAADLIIGKIENTKTVNLGLGDDIDALKGKISKSIIEVNQQEGVIVFVDLFGASPYNQAVMAISELPKSIRDKTYLITGVNLPMFLEGVNQQMINTDVTEAIDTVMEQAGEGVTLWSKSALSDNLDDDDEF